MKLHRQSRLWLLGSVIVYSVMFNVLYKLIGFEKSVIACIAITAAVVDYWGYKNETF